ncbi:RdgB/HAM1 family non-canonical purine NTP pyrophosphatase [uncultured Fibrella sp.]|uniref:RdgB/HAM1 family non-canonical purine NTP pyrophosphatase n=1 Tax=uncultured Fibrella sp. TaxID=1284596 RepID=UPI0035CA86B6
MELCFATNNAHKLEEVAAALGGAFPLRTLKEIGCTDELPETTGTIPGNSYQKAKYVFDHFGVACFADDTGLEVDALNGEPGVDSAYYAGEPRDNERNKALLLTNLEGQTNRRAQFRSVFTLVYRTDTGQVAEHQFEGIVTGTILTAPRGDGGFGYDPLFLPDGYTETFGELPLSEKNKISHRAKALAGLVAFLRELEKIS